MCTKVMQDTVAAARGLTFFSSPTLLPYALEFPFARIKYRLDTIPLPEVIYCGVLTTKPLEDRKFQFVNLCSLFSNTLFIRKQNIPKLQSYSYNLF